jgi:hypothetical protein
MKTIQRRSSSSEKILKLFYQKIKHYCQQAFAAALIQTLKTDSEMFHLIYNTHMLLEMIVDTTITMMIIILRNTLNPTRIAYYV